MTHSRMTRATLGAIGSVLMIASAAAAQGNGGMGEMHGPGMFEGSGGHAVTGHLMLAMKGGHTMVQLGSDFKADESKNVDVVLSTDMMYSANSSVMLGRLSKAKGMQEFTLPSGTMADHYRYALLRDRATGMVVGMAMLPAMGMMDKDGMMKRDSGMMKKPGGGGR